MFGKRRKKLWYPLSFPILGGRDSTRARFRFLGGSTSVTEQDERTDGRRKSLCLI